MSDASFDTDLRRGFQDAGPALVATAAVGAAVAAMGALLIVADAVVVVAD